MRVLITGCQGQLGWELRRSAPAGVEVIALGRGELDIGDAVAVERLIGELRPRAIVNAAAYTAVDRAESEPGLAYAVNAEGPGYLARAARDVTAHLVHISTDFIFDGNAGRPYAPDAAPAPLGVYGASKLEGERRVREQLGERALILRTAWVYSAHGANFVKTILRLLRERDELRVVADQIGSPTWAKGLATAVWRALEREVGGTHHWTDAGTASWYDFAVAIAEEARALGLVDRDVPIRPIRTEDYPTPAVRPAYSVLDKTATWAALELPVLHWREGLRGMLRELAALERG